jgi:hypothetical protein
MLPAPSRLPSLERHAYRCTACPLERNWSSLHAGSAFLPPPSATLCSLLEQPGFIAVCASQMGLIVPAPQAQSGGEIEQTVPGTDDRVRFSVKENRPHEPLHCDAARVVLLGAARQHTRAGPAPYAA